jgi:hypothetical protein
MYARIFLAWLDAQPASVRAMALRDTVERFDVESLETVRKALPSPTARHQFTALVDTLREDYGLGPLPVKAHA